MQRQLKRDWIAALRSGEYHQGGGQLISQDPEDNVTYCCLGVLCAVKGLDLWEEVTNSDWEDGTGLVLTRPISDEWAPNLPEFGLGTPENEANTIQHHLANMNDGTPEIPKATFAEIAQWIEDNIEEED